MGKPFLMGPWPGLVLRRLVLRRLVLRRLVLRRLVLRRRVQSEAEGISADQNHCCQRELSITS
ncbi:MAG: hypothetical protein ACK557_04305, partial [Planctomycetota bacterium]